MFVASWRIEIPKKSSVWRDAKSALAQHAEAAKGCSSV
jgi:hypothetical protein